MVDNYKEKQIKLDTVYTIKEQAYNLPPNGKLVLEVSGGNVDIYSSVIDNITVDAIKVDDKKDISDSLGKFAFDGCRSFLVSATDGTPIVYCNFPRLIK